MAIYRIYVEATAGHSVEIEADSEDEAVEKMWDEGDFPYSCHQCPEIGDWFLPSDADPKLDQSDFVIKISD